MTRFNTFGWDLNLNPCLQKKKNLTPSYNFESKLSIVLDMNSCGEKKKTLPDFGTEKVKNAISSQG